MGGDGSEEAGRRAIFVDRDGTIIEDRHYLSDPDGVHLISGAAEALARLNAAGLTVVLVTNQSGIGRGLFTADEYEAVHRELERQLAAHGVALDGVYVCPDSPLTTGLDRPTERSSPGTCRKPAPAMYRAAEAELGIDLRRSYYVGDKISDVAPATAFQGTGILVLTGYGRSSEGDVDPGCHVVADLRAAAALILDLEEAEAHR